MADVADDDDGGVDELLKLEARPRPVGVSTVSSCVWVSVRGRKVRTSRSRCGGKTVRLDARACGEGFMAIRLLVSFWVHNGA